VKSACASPQSPPRARLFSVSRSRLRNLPWRRFESPGRLLHCFPLSKVGAGIRVESGVNLTSGAACSRQAFIVDLGIGKPRVQRSVRRYLREMTNSLNVLASFFL
jgi:hypothetical protein